jgi:flavin-dependent dehydrogenase
MTVREELDDYVLKQTLGSGASLIKINKISGVSESADDVCVTTDAGVFGARFLIGADGANSTVRRLTEEKMARRFGFAIEGNIFDDTAHQPEMTFDFGVVPRGYGWIFPRRDHYNIGVYTYDARFSLFPAQLRSYARQKFGRDDVMNIVGCPIGMWGGGSPRVTNLRRVLLVGDAAGLCDPVLGEGIYYAIKSGQMAAASILEELEGGRPVHVGFQKNMKFLRSDLRVASKLALWFYRDLGIGCLALGSPLFRYALMKGYSLGIPLGHIPRELITLPFRRISILPSIEVRD